MQKIEFLSKFREIFPKKWFPTSTKYQIDFTDILMFSVGTSGTKTTALLHLIHLYCNLQAFKIHGDEKNSNFIRILRMDRAKLQVKAFFDMKMINVFTFKTSKFSRMSYL